MRLRSLPCARLSGAAAALAPPASAAAEPAGRPQPDIAEAFIPGGRTLQRAR